MEVVVSFPSDYMVNVIGQDWSRPNEEWKENSRKRFVVKGCIPYCHRHFVNVVPNHNETI